MATKQEFDFSVDILRSLLWQHNKAEHLESLLRAKQEWYNTNQRDFWLSWIRDVFDLRTANEFGLSVWAIILGLPLNIQTGASGAGKPAFGLGPKRRNFGRGNFTSATSKSIVLTKEQARLVLRLRYFQLVARCTVTDLNRFLKYLFGAQGDVHVLDANDMSFVTYIFNFSPDTRFEFLLQNFDVLPRPAGVGVKYLVIASDDFGFGEFNQNFYDSNFATEI